MNVSDYIAAEMDRPFLPGVTDCATTADRWFKIRCGWSPMEEYGRLVVDEARMDEWKKEPGGIVRGMKNVMRNVPRRRDRYVPGDVGIIAVEQKVCIAIRDVENWWSRDYDGFIVANDEYVFAAWKVG